MEQAKPVQQESPVHQIREEVERLVGQWVEELDFQKLTQKIQDFGSKNPIALSFAALTVGVAAGILMKKSIQDVQRAP